MKIPMSMFAIPLSLLFCLPSQKAALEKPADANVIGSVSFKYDGSVISHAHVWIHEESDLKSIEVNPDKSGKFSAHLPDGYYDVLISAPGYTPFCKKIWVRPDEIALLNVKLAFDTQNADHP